MTYFSFFHLLFFVASSSMLAFFCLQISTSDAYPSDPAEIRKIQENLQVIGWDITVDGDYGPQTTRMVKHFQDGWTFSTLLVDGDAGPSTIPQIEACVANGGYASTNFRFREFKSGGNGDIWVKRELLFGLESLRSAMGNKPLSIVSGYRDPAHNAAVGGASQSQHMFGTAADIPTSYGASYAFVKSLQLFSGIGVACFPTNTAVRHVDVRPGISKASPTSWDYC